ncbi:cation:proton antiporter [Streptomyces sp. NPDC057682]|uniref:cation:proton antiporter n=1 Tax=unclassified Streptomyces TaxID=2593676 RepID=UPI00364D1AFD
MSTTTEHRDPRRTTRHRTAPAPAAAPRRRPGAKTVGGALLLAAAAVLVLLLWAGEEWLGADTGSRSGTAGPDGHGTDPVLRMLVALPLVLAACHLAGRLAARVGQPPVMGEIVVGLSLGPSLLGTVWPEASAWLFPSQVLPVLDALGQLGLICFMFLIGYELDLRALRGSRATVLVVATACLVVPFCGGVLLSLPMYRPFAGDGVGFTAFALFLGVALSITAFPVLARILRDRALERTPVGSLALACAAFGDVLAWCLLAVVVAIAGSSAADPLQAAGAGLTTVLLTAAFATAMFLLVRPLLARLLNSSARGGRPEGSALPVLVAGLLLSAYATDAIGVHAVFGAFLFGLVTPRGTPAAERPVAHVEGFATAVLLPLFFVHTGLQTRFDLLPADWATAGWFLLALAAAVLTKGAGAVGSARWAGLGTRDSLALAALMNCRGLTELVVLSIGLGLGVITPAAFALLVAVTTVTTVVTAPLLRLIHGRGAGTATGPAPARRTPKEVTPS